MVVIGIVVVLTVGSIAGISASRSQRQVKTTAEKLKSFLMEARSMAMNPSDTSFGVAYIKVKIYPYTYTLDSSKTNKIELQGLDKNGAETGGVIKSFGLPSGISIDAEKSSPNGNLNSIDTGSKLYYYFTFDANSSSTIGQMGDILPTKFDIFLKIGPPDKIGASSISDEVYKVDMNASTGLITILPCTPTICK